MSIELKFNLLQPSTSARLPIVNWCSIVTVNQKRLVHPQKAIRLPGIIMITESSSYLYSLLFWFTVVNFKIVVFSLFVLLWTIVAKNIYRNISGSFRGARPYIRTPECRTGSQRFPTSLERCANLAQKAAIQLTNFRFLKN